MDARTLLKATSQWVPFAARTALYGSISLSLGPLTRDHRASLWAMRRWSRVSALGLDIFVEPMGLENVPKPPFVYACNHQSLLDVLVLGGVLPHDFKWAAKRSLMKIPFLGWHLQLAGHVPVDRQAGSRAAAEVIKRFEGVLQENKPLLIFPEGTRSEDGIVRPFKNGGFYAALRQSVPVVPVALDGTHRLMRKGAIHTDKGHIPVKIGAPIQPHKGMKVTDLRDLTHAAIIELHRSIGGHVPDVVPPNPLERGRDEQARSA
ncbi:MAG: lysophospholipid acyltransferase family protein [Polyangiaceae bacterium]